MMILKDDKGRPVAVSRENNGLEFHAVDGDELVPVPEAVIAVSDTEPMPSEAWMRKQFTDAGLPPAALMLDLKANDCYNRIDLDGKEEWVGRNSFFGNSTTRHVYSMLGNPVADVVFNKARKIVDGIRNFHRFYSDGISYSSYPRSTEAVLSMIGEGAVVTPESLNLSCAKGGTRSRLAKGDSVEVTVRGKKLSGTIVSLGNKVNVLLSNGKKGSYAYPTVVRTEGMDFDAAILAELDKSLSDNFAAVLATQRRLYKAQVKMADVTIPVFPHDHERPVEHKNVPSCECPLCGWPMAEHTTGWHPSHNKVKEFHCSFCRARGILAHIDASSVTLLMLRQPAKNRFAIREARCCANCGLFEFEVGRQGKRSTGYCSATNQCVQTFSTCSTEEDAGYWFPREPERYAKNLSQHATNLGYGVSDKRNTKRTDIRDTVYRREDHEVQQKRAERAKVVYAAAYAKFMADVGKVGDGRQALTDEMTDEQKEKVREHFRRVLDDGC